MRLAVDVDWACSTGGDGFWTDRSSVTRITRLELAFVSNDGRFGELRAHLDPSSWNAEQLGYVYTDRTWIATFRLLLESLGFSGAQASRVNYSEQGMQGDDYVSMDVSEPFLEAWKARLP